MNDNKVLSICSASVEKVTKSAQDLIRIAHLTVKTADTFDLLTASRDDFAAIASLPRSYLKEGINHNNFFFDVSARTMRTHLLSRPNLGTIVVETLVAQCLVDIPDKTGRVIHATRLIQYYRILSESGLFVESLSLEKFPRDVMRLVMLALGYDPKADYSAFLADRDLSRPCEEFFTEESGLYFYWTPGGQAEWTCATIEG